MKNLYQCDVCKTAYEKEENALACESHKPISKFNVGDTVFFKTRYEGIQSDVIGGKGLKNGLNPNLSPDRAVEYLHDPFHEWAYLLRQTWQWGKEFYSDTCFESYLFATKEEAEAS